MLMSCEPRKDDLTVVGRLWQFCKRPVGHCSADPAPVQSTVHHRQKLGGLMYVIHVLKSI
jgi:hypothetical protein